MLERQQDAPELIDFLKRTISSIRQLRQADWLTILNSQARCVAYYDDRQYGEARDGRWIDYQRRPGDVRPLDNQYKIQVDKLLMEIARAFPDIQALASDPNDTMKVEGAKFAQYRLKTNRKRLLKKKFRLREAMALLTKSMTWRYTVFNAQAKDSPTVKRPRKGKKSYGQTRSLRTCGLCGGPMKAVDLSENIPTSSDSEQSYKCASCGSNRVKMVEVSAQEREVVEGYDEAKGGCVQTYHIDPCMVRISLAARESVADSPFLWYTQMIARCILEAAYPDYRITNTGQITDQARYRRDAESVPSNADQGFYPYQNHSNTQESPTEGGNQFEELQFDLFWIDPSVYAGRTWDKPQKLRGGRVLPAGQSLDQLFPDGMCVAATAANEVLDCYPEDKNKKWTFCVYGVREWALVGSGTNALLGPQDTRNDLKAYLIANNYYNAGRRESIRAGSYTGNRLPSMDQVAVVKNVPDDKMLEGWAHSMAPGNPLPAQSMELYQSEGGAMQDAAGTSSLSTQGAAPDLKAMGTATGVAAMRDQAVGRMGPNLMLLTDMEEEHSYQVLEQEQEGYRNNPEIFMRMANQSVTAEDTDGSITFSAEGVEAFMQMDIRADLDISATEGSWMPRTEGEKQAKFQWFTEIAANVMKVMGDDPRGHEIIGLAASIAGIDFKADNWTPTEHVAAARIRALADTCGVMEKRGLKQPTEENVMQVIASTPDAMIDNEMDSHSLFVLFYRNWWSSDEGQSCSPLLRAVIKAEEILHRKGIVYQKQEEFKDKIEGEAPQMVAAKATAAENAPPPPPPDIPYKDAPPDIRRQEEQRAGYIPSQMGETPEDDGTAAEAAKTQGALAVQQHQGELDSEQMREQAKLELVEKAHEAAIDETRAQADHAREQESAAVERDHETGIKGAEMMVKSHEGDKSRAHEAQTKAAEHRHESHESATERAAESKRLESEHRHQQKSQSEQHKSAVTLAKLKPPTRKPQKK